MSQAYHKELGLLGRKLTLAGMAYVYACDVSQPSATGFMSWWAAHVELALTLLPQ